MLSYLHTDHLGTPRYASNTSGVQVWNWSSDAFGNGTPTGTATVNLRFAGQYWDSESGLHYNWNRYYDPTTGRYITSDPIGLAGGLNTYGYALANPVMFTDPEGLEAATANGGARIPRSVGIGTAIGIAARSTPVGRAVGIYLNGVEVCARAGGQAIGQGILWAQGNANEEEKAETDGAEEEVDKKKTGKRKSIEVKHKNRKEAKEAAKKKGKPLPEPPKDASGRKKKAYAEQQKYKNPESHPNSDHPKPHYHDSDKSSQPVNRHHTYPKR